MQDDVARLFARTAEKVAVLAEMPVGPTLVAKLFAVTREPMNAATAVDVTALWVKVESWVAGQRMISTAGVVHGIRGILELDPNEALMLAGQELASATKTSYSSNAHQVGLVERVSDCLPASWEALDRGALTVAHLKAVERETRGCSPRIAQLVDEQVVPLAIDRGWTPSETAKAARKLLIANDPEGAQARAAAARDESDVRIYNQPDGIATVEATGPAERARELIDTVDNRAKAMALAGDDRPVGVRRFDALYDLALGFVDDRAKKAARGTTLLHLGLDTYLGVNDKPGELVGYGPITAEHARVIAEDTMLRRLVTDPLTGAGVDLGRTAYRPSAALRRYVEATNLTCSMPGCCRPVHHCEIDHRDEYDRLHNPGRTDRCNLEPLCKMHHQMKTKKRWKVDVNPDGSETWTSFLGFTYTKRPSYFPLPDPPPIEDEPPIELADRLPETFDPDPPREDDPLPEPPALTDEEYDAADRALSVLELFDISFREWVDKHYDEMRATGLVA